MSAADFASGRRKPAGDCIEGWGETMSFKKRSISIALLVCTLGVAGAWAQSTSASLKAPDSSATGANGAAKPPIAVPPEYVVGESDVLHVNVWKEPEVTQTVIVRTDGNISLPLINDVRVAGLTPLQIQNMIADKLKAFLTNPQVTVTVTDIRSKRAFITGEVARPGGYPLNTETNVLQLIAQAGGLTPFAKKDSITVLRFENGKELRLAFKYSQVVHGKKADQNIALRPGDTVVVP
jgi:polysaccharide biosynthesis/export protein